MTSPLVQKLQLVVDANTGTAKAELDGLSTAAVRTGEAADKAATSVAAAAERESAARNKARDAAGALAVADQRLIETRARYADGSSQVIAAQNRQETATRNLHLANRDVESATRARAAAEADASGNTDRAARSTSALAGELKGLAALAAGAAIVTFGRNAADAFLDGSRTAGMLATSMNATVEEGGQLGALVRTIGLDFDDLIEIQAEFAQKVAANSDELENLGVTINKNADGTINWATTLEETLGALQNIPDATERNRLGFAYFGEEGYKQLSRLVNSGKSVQEALDQIGTPFDEGDVQAAYEFDQALLELQLTGGAFARTVGSELVPALTGVFSGLNSLVSIAGSIPGPLLLGAGAAVALGFAQRAAATEGSFLAGAMATVQGAAGRFTAATAVAATSSGVLGTAMGAARVAGGGLLGLVGGPLGAGFLAAGVGVSLLTGFLGDNEGQAERTAQASQDLTDAIEQQNGVITDSVRQQAAKSLQDAGVLDALEAIGVSTQDATDGLLGNAAAYERVQAAIDAYYDSSLTAENAGDLNMTENAEAARVAGGAYADLAGDVGTATTNSTQLATAVGGAADAQALATQATETLTAAIESGQTSGEQYEQLVRAAAEAQDVASAATDGSTAAIEAYNAVTRDAVDTVLGLINANLASQDAQYGFLNAVDAANAAVDDQATSVDEVAEANTRLQSAALTAADAAADAAVNAARAAGQPLTDLAEAQVRADAVIANLQANLSNPSLSAGARDQIQGIIDQLVTASASGDIVATLEAVGVAETTAEVDTATEDRETTVAVESRGGPAVIAYLDGIAGTTRLAIVQVESRGGPAVIGYLAGLAAATRLAIVQVESRGGPAVIAYLAAVAGANRLAIISVESRGGPAVDGYLNSLTRGRLAIINVETRGGPAVESYLDQLARPRNAVINVRQQAVGAPVSAGPVGAPASLRGAPSGAGSYSAGGVTVQTLSVTVAADGAGRVRPESLAEAGRSVVSQLSAYTAQNGPGWLGKLDRR